MAITLRDPRPSSWKRPFVVLFICILFLPWGRTAAAGEGAGLHADEVLALGAAKVIEGNMAEARERAVSQALRKGLEQYVLGRLKKDGAVNNFERIMRDVVPGAGEQIQNYHILAERQMDGTYGVLVQARINAQAVDQRMKDAGVVLLEGPPVKLLFLVSEQNDGALRYWWEHPEAGALLSPLELALHREFQERGFAPVNRALGMPDVPGGDELRTADLPMDAVQVWGRLFSADVVLCGRMRSVTGREIAMDLKAVDVETGAVMVEATGVEEAGAQPEGALASIARKMAAELAPGILSSIGAERGRVHTLSVTLTGITSYQQFSTLKAFFEKEVHGVDSVVQTRIRKNAITVAVEFQGDRTTFQDRVLTHENLPVKLEPLQSEGDVIVFNVR